MILSNKIGDYEVTYDTFTEEYQVSESEAVIKESKSYQVIEKFLETGGEKKEKPKRLNVKIWLSACGEYKEAIITSLAEKRYRVQEVWVLCDGKRKKEDLSSCYKYTDDNLVHIKKIKELYIQIKDINERLHQTRIAMSHVEIGDLIEKGT